jgi:homoserine kinase
VKITVRAPASSGNLGSGFDCLGLALDIWTEVTVETGKANGQGHGLSRLVWQGVEAAFQSVGAPPEMRIEADGGIPIARGLGASAALRAAGLLAGNALLDNLHDTEALISLGTALEGHPDNISPCLLGGCQVNVRDAEGKVLHQQASLPDDLQVVVFVPDFEMPTQESRRKIPKQLSREDAVFNVGRAALLVAALAAGNYDLLDEATQDRIHQPARSEIFPGLVPIMNAAKEAGASASFLSGGGSTVAAWVHCDDTERVGRLMTQAAISKGFSGRSIITKPTLQGAHIV